MTTRGFRIRLAACLWLRRLADRISPLRPPVRVNWEPVRAVRLDSEAEVSFDDGA